MKLKKIFKAISGEMCKKNYNGIYFDALIVSQWIHEDDNHKNDIKDFIDKEYYFNANDMEINGVKKYWATRLNKKYIQVFQLENSVQIHVNDKFVNIPCENIEGDISIVLTDEYIRIYYTIDDITSEFSFKVTENNNIKTRLNIIHDQYFTCRDNTFVLKPYDFMEQ